MRNGIMDNPSSKEITSLLKAWTSGSEGAQEVVWPKLYDQLKGLAKTVLRGKGRNSGMQTTVLVNEAYLRLLGSDVDWNDRRHFFAVAARAMRFVLVDEARKRSSQKRGPEDLSAEFPEEVADPQAMDPEMILAVHQGIERLREVNPRYEQLVELRYFAGLSINETAEVLDVSRPTVVRDWKAVRVWLHNELSGQGS